MNLTARTPPNQAGAESQEAWAKLALADWRREIAELYATVRETQDPARAHSLWRERRDQLFQQHPQSPLHNKDPLRTTGLPYWPYNEGLRFEVPVITAPQREHTITTASDETTCIRQIGWVELPGPVAGRLAVWWLVQYGGGIFVPFRDATAGRASYGGGRYVLDSAKGADLGGEAGNLVIDFNFSYHPSCRYDDAWLCPLAPPENALTEPIEAGERLS